MHGFLVIWTILIWSIPAYAKEGEPIKIISEQIVGAGGNATFTRSFDILLTTADGILYQGTGTQNMSSRLAGPLAGCTHNIPASAPVSLIGRRNGDSLSLTLTIDLPKVNFQIHCRNGGGGSLAPMGPNSGQITIPFEDNYIHRTQFPGLDASIRLQRACSSTRETTLKVVHNFPRPVFEPVHYTLNNALSSDEIKNRRTQEDPSDDTQLGLAITRLPKILLTTGSRPANWGTGTCGWLDEVEFTYPKADIYVNKNYRPGTCNFRATLEHEELHYTDWISLSSTMHAALGTNLQKMKVPLKGTPVWFASKLVADEGVTTLAKQGLDKIVRIDLKNSLIDQKNRQDTAEKYQLVYAKCPRW